MKYLTPAPSVTWVTDQRCTILVQENSGAVFQLTGLSEVLWDCLVQGFSYVEMIQIIGEMRSITSEAAEEMVQGVFREWRDLGIVSQEEGELG